MRHEKHPAVYMVANRYRGTIYIGVTSELWNRIWSHKNGTTPGFTSQYKANRLVWYEHRQTMESAIRREKALKAWKRDWKIELIERMNPDCRDLHDETDLVGHVGFGLKSLIGRNQSWTPAFAGVTAIIESYGVPNQPSESRGNPRM